MILKYFKNSYPDSFIKVANKIGRKYEQNINLDLLNPNQKHVMLCYLYLGDKKISDAHHTNILRANQMIKCLIDFGYCIDVCDCVDDFSYYALKDKKYDVILGFGHVYTLFALSNLESRKILFVTENNPLVVSEKYAERIAYFKKRHPHVDCRKSLIRNNYYDVKQYEISDLAIVVSSNYNANTMKPYFENIYTINSNAFFNSNFSFNPSYFREAIEKTKRHFLWFGSDGIIHKGADILIDAFKEMPNCYLDLYGISEPERKLVYSILGSNTHDCGRVNPLREEFIEKVVKKHCFLIFPSCSEGMSTAVGTCMAHGIIPILTKDCGYEPCEYIIQLDGWRVEDIKAAVHRVLSMSNEEILRMREGCYRYAREQFSLMHFDKSFRGIIKEIAK